MLYFGDTNKMTQKNELLDRIRSGVSLTNVLSSWLSNSSSPRIIINDNYQIIWMNDRFITAFKNFVFISIDRDYLRFRRPKDQEIFDAFTSNAEKKDLFMIFDNYGTVSAYAAQISKISYELEKYHCFQLMEYDDVIVEHYKNFEQIFRMTKTEVDICRMLLSGNSVEKISASKGKSKETIRFHIHNIYGKMDVSSREEFFAKMSRFFYF
jgi:DNA-binding CsgD family transcriptional regulator